MTKIRSSDSSMIDERRGRGGSGGSGGFSFPGSGGGRGRLPFPIKAGGGLLGIVLLLAATILPRLLNTGASPASTLGSASDGDAAADVADGTCSSDLEQIVCGAVVDVQDYWAVALPKYFQVPYESTKAVFFTGGTDTGCGPATSATGPFYCPADRLVYIDLGFMQQLESQLIGSTSDLAEQYIVATSSVTTCRTCSARMRRRSRRARTILRERTSTRSLWSCRPIAMQVPGSVM